MPSGQNLQTCSTCGKTEVVGDCIESECRECQCKRLGHRPVQGTGICGRCGCRSLRGRDAMSSDRVQRAKRRRFHDLTPTEKPMNAPEDNPADEVEPTREEWEEYERRRSAEPDPTVPREGEASPQGLGGVVCFVVATDTEAHRELLDLCAAWHRRKSNSLYVDQERSLLAYRSEGK